jgi:hypothetical protein
MPLRAGASDVGWKCMAESQLRCMAFSVSETVKEHHALGSGGSHSSALGHRRGTVSVLIFDQCCKTLPRTRLICGQRAASPQGMASE